MNKVKRQILKLPKNGIQDVSFSDFMQAGIKAFANMEANRKKPTGLVCEYCGATREKVMFMIGASLKKDWCMHEGTGKVACPDCYDKAQAEATARLDNSRKVNTMPKLSK